MRSKCKVSICCLTYNHENYIGVALDSMVNQITDFDYEIIVLDDCSSDNTREVINDFVEKYPKKVRKVFQSENQYKKNVPIVNQIFYPLARGEYIAYCEGDDYWTDNKKLQRQVNFLDSHHEYIAHTHECWEVDEKGNKIVGYYFNGCYKKHYDIETHCSMQILSGQTATIMHRKEAFSVEGKQALEELGHLKVTGDVKKTAILLMSGPIYHDGYVMSHHRRIYNKGDSWSAQNSERNLRIFYFDALDELSVFLEKYFGRSVSYEKFKIKMTATSLYLIILRKERIETFKHMFLSMKGTKHLYAKLFFMIIQLPFIRIIIKANRKNTKN